MCHHYESAAWSEVVETEDDEATEEEPPEEIEQPEIADV